MELLPCGITDACSHVRILQLLVRLPDNGYSCLLYTSFHIHNAEKQKYQVIADYLQEYLPRQIGVCHCTGVEMCIRDRYKNGMGLWIYFLRSGYFLQFHYRNVDFIRTSSDADNGRDTAVVFFHL